jgi:hypothetical protein
VVYDEGELLGICTQNVDQARRLNKLTCGVGSLAGIGRRVSIYKLLGRVTWPYLSAI